MKFPKSKKEIAYFSILLIIGITGIVATLVFIFNLNKEKSISNFDECAKYYPVQESFPERCTTKDGKTFVKPQPAKDIEITGTIVCLPHRDKTGPQTLECAMGLESDGIYYSLYNPSEQTDLWTATNKKINIKGTFTPNTDPNEKYDIVGKIEVKSYSF